MPRSRAVGLAELADLPALYLSAGQRRRLSLARLIAIPRPIWLLDEPTSALDRRGAELAGRSHARASRRRRPASGGNARADRARRHPGAAVGREPVTALTAILLRDLRLAVRVGGGALIGVLFFLIVVTLVPFAIGPDLVLLARIGPAILWLGALLASLLALDRLIAMDHEDGSLDLILTARAAARACACGQGAGALAHHRLAAGDRRAVSWPAAQSRPDGDRRGRADAARRDAGADLHRPDRRIALTVALRRGGLLLAVLVLPLTVPVLIFGVAAANAAIVGPMPFGTPFSILCALTLMSIVIGPFAAAVALRQGSGLEIRRLPRDAAVPTCDASDRSRQSVPLPRVCRPCAAVARGRDSARLRVRGQPGLSARPTTISRAPP